MNQISPVCSSSDFDINHSERLLPSMPPHKTQRQPLSCENCRKRKIKCSGTQVPCESCTRRGYPHSCYYKRVADFPSPLTPTSTESELLCRIRNLEDLLKQQISQSSRSPSDLGPFHTLTRSERSSSHAGSEQASARNDELLQSGSIITSPSGYQRFYPRTSTLDAGLVQELTECNISPFASTNFPFSSDSTGTRSALLHALPPQRQCDELKDVFFQVFSPVSAQVVQKSLRAFLNVEIQLFHILHDPTFDKIYNEFRQDPSSASSSWLALLFVVLAIAVTALDEDHPLLRDLGRESSATANIKSLSARYRSAAMQFLSANQFLYQHNLYTVQALVLLIYAMNHANIPSWALLGTAWNIAVAIGCHIDPSQLSLHGIEAEERRRCWAALMMLYTIQNTCLGNIAPQIVTATVNLPADKDDDNLLEGDDEMAGNSFNFGTKRPSKMSYILYKFKLYKIAAEICQSTLNQRPPDDGEFFDLDQTLEKEQREHDARFSKQNLPIYHIAHHYILQLYTHHLYLVLHRPRLSAVYASFNRNSMSTQGQLRSQMRCLNSATAILEIHEHLYHSAEYRPYRWFVHGLGSFTAFLAVSTLIVLSTSAQICDQDPVHILGLINKSLQRFREMAYRSDICLKASMILARVVPNFSNGMEKLTPHIEQPADGMRDTNFHVSRPDCVQHPLSPPSSVEQITFAPCEWTIDPQLEALFFDMAPEQWMTPSTFSWDKWSSAIFT